jgi:hypothetical protein
MQSDVQIPGKCPLKEIWFQLCVVPGPQLISLYFCKVRMIIMNVLLGCCNEKTDMKTKLFNYKH